ncbi:N-acetylneuraminate epimerase [bacterium HR36]|nr:N-acetylneuraminate epimerase [bacterium HR36]
MAIRVGFTEQHSGEYEGNPYKQVRHYLTLVAKFDKVSEQIWRIEELPKLPIGLASFGAAALGDHIYVFGGHSGRAHQYHEGNVHGALYRLNWRRPQQWERLGDAEPGQGLAFLAARDKLYRIGGMRALNRQEEEANLVSLSTFTAYDVRNEKWEPLPQLPESRSSCDAALVGSRIYVFGGWKLGPGGRTWYDYGLVFDLEKPQQGWQRLPQPFRRRALAVVAWKEQIYVLGGLRADGKLSLEVDIFDPLGNSWRKGPELPGPVQNGFSPAVCVHNGALYLSPGDGKLYRYQNNRWQLVGSVPPFRVSHRLISLPDGRLCVLGGSPRAPKRNAAEDMLSLVQAIRLTR